MRGVIMNKFSIETGYFIFTLMPSLRCSLNCPHCYLSLEQRRSSEIMPLDGLRDACIKVDDYYVGRGIQRKTIVNYWYGGEPTEMPKTEDGTEYIVAAANMMDSVFSREKGYETRHVILSSLVTVDNHWYPIFQILGRGYVQSSFDWLMRGKGYMKKWEKKAREVVSAGLSLGTISVVNRELINFGPESALDYLADIGVVETSWLPFMLNEQNSGEKYDTFAPSMHEYSDFMLRLSEHWIKRRLEGASVPRIGQMEFIAKQGERLLGNIAGQTLFLLPNGDFVLPDYKEGYKEYMRVFGNIKSESFESILTSSERRDYLRRQALRNGNHDCSSCNQSDRCLMEFWKPNKGDDDCFGAKRYVEWVAGNKHLDSLVKDGSVFF